MLALRASIYFPRERRPWTQSRSRCLRTGRTADLPLLEHVCFNYRPQLAISIHLPNSSLHFLSRILILVHLSFLFFLRQIRVTVQSRVFPDLVPLHLFPLSCHDNELLITAHLFMHHFDKRLIDIKHCSRDSIIHINDEHSSENIGDRADDFLREYFWCLYA